MKNTIRGGAFALVVMVAGVSDAQSPMMSSADMKAMAAHMEMTKLSAKNTADSIRAAKLVIELRVSIAKYLSLIHI